MSIDLNIVCCANREGSTIIARLLLLTSVLKFLFDIKIKKINGMRRENHVYIYEVLRKKIFVEKNIRNEN